MKRQVEKGEIHHERGRMVAICPHALMEKKCNRTPDPITGDLERIVDQKLGSDWDFGKTVPIDLGRALSEKEHRRLLHRYQEKGWRAYFVGENGNAVIVLSYGSTVSRN